MSNIDNHDLFTASLESIETSKRVEKFQRFKNDFQRDCFATLDNAQEWIKAELPIITDYIDATAIKDELKQSKTSDRRKHLLSALLFEKSTREAISSNNAPVAAIMAIHMFNHVWQAKVELYGTLPAAATSKNTQSASQISPNETYNDTREKILTSLIKKGEMLKEDTQIQSKIKSPKKKPVTKKKATPQKSKQTPAPSKKGKPSTPTKTKKKVDTWAEELEKDKQRKLALLAEKNKNKKSADNLKKNTGNKKKKSADNLKKKAGNVFSKVKTKIPLKGRKKLIADKFSGKQENESKDNYDDDELFDDPNRSAIMVSTGFSDDIDDTLIQERKLSKNNPKDSGVTVHKVLKAREHTKQEPGSNTIIMKLASGSKRSGEKLSLPEQCQDAINELTEKFPGYDMVAIRNMAAEKVGVSPQYIMNLNILPEKTG